MLFYLTATGCETFAVALITADSLLAATKLVVSKFKREPDDVKINDNHARISFNDFVRWEDVEDVMDLGDVGGDIADRYDLRPVPAGDYVKIGCYTD